MTTLVTGASGFVGARLCSQLYANKQSYIGVVRNLPSVGVASSVDESYRAVGDIRPDTDWSELLRDIDCVVHCAARSHVMHETELDPLKAYRAVNVENTVNLARHAAAVGVRRFIFLSSIKVNGEKTCSVRTNASSNDLPKFFAADDKPRPEDAYGISKCEAEQALKEVSERTGLEVVTIRPPLVYGPGVKGNFLTMMRWLSRGVPLPFGAVDNRRSLVGLDNLVDLIITCINHPGAPSQTFLVSDDEDLSMPDLLERMGKALNMPARLVPVPEKLLRLGALLTNKQEIAQRLLGSLAVDISKTKQVLSWTPPISVDQGLRDTAKWYQQG